MNDKYRDIAENLGIPLLMYNSIKYRHNYSDTSGILCQFNRDGSTLNDAGNPVDVFTNNSTSFKYKSNFLGE